MHFTLRIGKLLLALSFTLLLFIPLFEQITGLLPVPFGELKELRRKIPMPKLKAKDPWQFPKQFDRYYGDNFGFRDFLIKLNNSIRFSIFGVSPTKTVLLGKDGWLYHTGNHSIEYYQGLNLFTESELKKLTSIYQARNDYLKSLGIDYYVLVTPSKESIYPEYYPDYIRKVSKINRYDQFYNYLTKHSSVKIVDIQAALLKAKSHGQLYRKSDGHWNSYGAYFAYQELFKTLQSKYPNLEMTKIEDFSIETRYEEGELGRMLGLLFPIKFSTPYLKHKVPDPWYAKAVSGKKKGGLPLRIDRLQKIDGKIGKTNTQLPKLMVYRDSFFMALTKYIALNFTESTYYTTHRYEFDPVAIENEKPTVVIDQMVERYLRVPSGIEVPIINLRTQGVPLAEIGTEVGNWHGEQLADLFVAKDDISITKDGVLIQPQRRRDPNIETKPLNLRPRCRHLATIVASSEPSTYPKIHALAKGQNEYIELPVIVHFSKESKPNTFLLPYPAVPRRLRFTLPGVAGTIIQSLRIKELCK